MLPLPSLLWLKWHLKVFLHQCLHLQGRFGSLFLLWLEYGIGMSKFKSLQPSWLSWTFLIAGEITLFFPRAGFLSCSISKNTRSRRSRSLPRSCCVARQDWHGEGGDLKWAGDTPWWCCSHLCPLPCSHPPKPQSHLVLPRSVAGSACPSCPFLWFSCYFLLLFTSTAVYLGLNVINSTFGLFLKAKYLWKVILSQTHIPSLAQI